MIIFHHFPFLPYRQNILVQKIENFIIIKILIEKKLFHQVHYYKNEDNYYLFTSIQNQVILKQVLIDIEKHFSEIIYYNSQQT